MTDAPRILVTGATGKVGGALVGLLAGRGVRPRALVRDRERAAAQLGNRAELVTGDLADPASVVAAMAGVERAFVLTRTGDHQYAQEQAAIEAAAQARTVRHVVKLSVHGAGPGSPLHHGRWQWRADELLRRSAVGYTVLQLSFLMQNLVTMIRGGVIRSSTGDGRLAMVDARDVAAAAAAMLLAEAPPSQTVTLTGPRAHTFDETAAVLAEATGVPIAHERVTSADVAAMVSRFGAPQWYAEDLATFNDLAAAGRYAEVTVGVASLAGAPPRSLAQFARDHAVVLRRGAVG